MHGFAKRVWIIAVISFYLAAPGSLFAQTMKVRGRVDDIAGRPIAGADVVVVQVRSEGPSRHSLRELAQTKSTVDGAFIIDWPTGQSDASYAYLRATFPSYAYSWARRAPESKPNAILWLDEQRNVSSFEPRLTLLPECTLTGQVVNPQGEPVAGAEVRVQIPRPLAITDAQGRFTFTKLPPTNFEYTFNVNWIYIRHPDYLTKEMTPGNGSDPNQLTVEKPVDLRVALARGGIIRGRVTDADSGQLRTGFIVRGIIPSGKNWKYGEGAPIAADGSYQLRLPPGPVRIALIRPDEGLPPEAADFYPVQDVVEATASEETEAKVDLQVKRGTRLTGRVVLPDTWPVSSMADLRVNLEEAKPATDPGVTDRRLFTHVGPRGEFALPGVRPADYDLRLILAFSSGAAPITSQSITVPADGALPEQRIGPTGNGLPSRLEMAIVGRVLLPDGTPASWARIIYIPPVDAQGLATRGDAFTSTSAGGDFSLVLPSYLPANSRLYVRDATGIYAAVVSATASIQRTPIEIKLVEGGRARGRVLDDQGKPVVGWTVVYNRINANWAGGGGGGHAFPRPRFAATFTDAQGNYELTGLLPLTPADQIEIAMVPDLMITGSTMLPGRDNPEWRSHGSPLITPGKTRDGLDFVTSMKRRGVYTVIPETRSAP